MHFPKYKGQEAIIDFCALEASWGYKTPLICLWKSEIALSNKNAKEDAKENIFFKSWKESNIILDFKSTFPF